jgi:hypothetical protein
MSGTSAAALGGGSPSPPFYRWRRRSNHAAVLDEAGCCARVCEGKGMGRGEEYAGWVTMGR